MKAVEEAQRRIHNIVNNVEKVIVGKTEQIRQSIACWLAGGHILIEDVPGTGKTILARSLAASVDVPFGRVQFTPDLLPSDILGHSVYRKNTDLFEFRQGPIFTGLFLADEINRATPRTQSGLLEAMSEKQVSIDGQSYRLDPLFFVMATQNPLDQLGTFSLPEAQRDRFMMEISMGYPGIELEKEVIRRQLEQHPLENLQPVESAEIFLAMKALVSKVQVSDEVLAYVMDIVAATRSSRLLKMGVSPRASIALTKAAQAMSLIEGEAFVRPQTIRKLAPIVLRHRLSLNSEARLTEKSLELVVQEILQQVVAPVGKM